MPVCVVEGTEAVRRRSARDRWGRVPRCAFGISACRRRAEIRSPTTISVKLQNLHVSGSSWVLTDPVSLPNRPGRARSGAAVPVDLLNGLVRAGPDREVAAIGIHGENLPAPTIRTCKGSPGSSNELYAIRCCAHAAADRAHEPTRTARRCVEMRRASRAPAATALLPNHPVPPRITSTFTHPDSSRKDSDSVS